MIHNLKVLGPVIGAILAMGVFSSPVSAAPEFTCAEGGIHVSCKIKGTTEPGTSDIIKTAAPILCHSTYEGSSAFGTTTKLSETVTGVKKPFDAFSGATVNSDCEAEVGGVRFTADVNFEGCGYEFHPIVKLASNEYTATVDLLCPFANYIDINITNSAGATKCKLKIFSQSILQHAILKNTVNPTTGKEVITVNATVENIRYTSEVGGILGCGITNGEHTGAVWSAKITMEAFNTLGSAIDGTVAGG